MFKIQSCAVCGTLVSDPKYRRDEYGRGLYWANPKICSLTEVRVEFCGAGCSTTWTVEKLGAREETFKENPGRSAAAPSSTAA